MYQGKYAADRKRPAAPRAAAPAPRRAEAPAAPDLQQPAQQTVQSVQSQHAAQAVRPAQPRQSAPASKGKRRPRRHTVIFYSIYVLGILAFVIGAVVLMGMLESFLQSFEASQPNVRSQEVFEDLFRKPDWDRLYRLSGQEAQGFNDAQSFRDYMEAKVGDRRLSFIETSLGLSADKKYYVRLNEENIGAFTLTNRSEDEARPDWELKKLELFTEALESVEVNSYPGYEVRINGVLLGEDRVIRSTVTAAESFLPEGLTGYRTVTYRVDGLLTKPAVTVTDPAGQTVSLSYDEAARSYSHELSAEPISQAQLDFMDKASQAYGRFMLKDLSKSNLKKYFTGKSYDAIVEADLDWVQNFQTAKFGAQEVTEYVVYSDTLSSARVHRVLYVTRGNGSIKEFDINTTYFMEKSGSSWTVTQLTFDENVQKPISQIRLDFMQDGELLESRMVDAASHSLSLPAVAAPEGKTFSGWFRQSVNAEGKTVMTLVFQPDENGSVNLPSGYALEPMTLHAIFK